MTDYPAGGGQANQSAAQSAGQPTFGAGPADAPGYPSGSGQSTSGVPAAKGFLAALFDFGFTSFVTPKIIKVLYVLIVVLAAIGALVYAAFGFSLNVVVGVLVLFVVAPLIFLITTALYRIALETFMIIFRIAEDIRAIRDNGGAR